MATSTGSAAALRRRLRALANPDHARTSQWFFKTGPGEYGEGDKFLGIRVPVLRGLVREFAHLKLSSVVTLLHSPWHEERLLAVLLLVRQYDKADPAGRARIYAVYVLSLRYINNWDIVDSSAPQIVGRHLAGKGRATLVHLAKTRLVWSRRVAVMATFHTIRQGKYSDTLAIAKLLLGDEHDLIHKASGWMLREVGQRDRAALERFLDRHASRMPRTMLRYAIEKLPEARRQGYLGR